MSILDARAITKTPTQANLLRIILSLHEKTTLELDGKKVLSIQLSKLAQLLGAKAASTAYRALCWLQEQGIVQVIRGRWNRSPRLYVRPLIRPRATSTQSVRNVTDCADATSYKNPPEKEENLKCSGEDAPPPRKKVGLRGNLGEAPETISQKQEVTRARAGEQPPKPRAAAIVWNRLLSEYGYPGFDADALKHLAGVKTTIKRLDLPTLDQFKDELERRIGLWQNKRPAQFRKTPPHPWAVNRTWAIFEVEELTFTELPQVEPQLEPEPVKHTDKPDQSVVSGYKFGKGFFGLFKNGKDGK